MKGHKYFPEPAAPFAWADREVAEPQLGPSLQERGLSVQLGRRQSSLEGLLATVPRLSRLL